MIGLFVNIGCFLAGGVIGFVLAAILSAARDESPS